MKIFEIIRASRKKILEITDNLSLEAVNHIPERMNNNVVWNMAHLISTQQNLCYVKCGLPTAVDASFIERYKVGTKPGGFIDAVEYAGIRSQLLSHVDELEEDYNNGRFLNFEGFASKTYPGLVVNKFEDVLSFIAFHEGIHLGYVMAMRRHIVV
jgi:hypothetical protein